MTDIVRAGAEPGGGNVYAAMFSQGGKSQGLYTLIGHKLDDNPAPILYVGPTRSNIEKVIEPKVDAMLRSTPSLWAKTIKGQKYTTLRKLIAGVSLRFAWAGSPTELAADSAELVLVDEVDRMAANIKGEGNVIELADARHSTYANGRTVGVSSPTLGNVETETHPETGIEHWKVAESDQIVSQIWALFQGGSRHEWAWPCPDCGQYFVPRRKLLWWPEDATPEEAEREARLTCPRCGVLIEQRHKVRMNARGRFVAPGQSVDQDGTVRGAPPPSRQKTFWVSGLANFAATATWGRLAASLLRAINSGEDERIQGVVNTGFGELYRFGGDAPKASDVKARRGSYLNGTVPDGVNVLTAFVDVQGDRLPYVVRGWGANFESWLIEHDEIWGDTRKAETWAKLADLLDRDFGGFSIARMGIDSGYRTDEVYGFCLAHRRNVVPTKGHDHLSRPFYASKIEVSPAGKPIKAGLQLWHFDAGVAKSWVHARVEGTDDDVNAWHLPADITDDYCAQIVAEEQIATPDGGAEWVRLSRNNHALDCEAGCYIMARSVRVVNRRIAYTGSQAAPAARNVAARPQRAGRRQISAGIQI